MNLQKSTIYINEYLYSTLSGENIEYRALSYKELEIIQNKYKDKRNQSQIITVKLSLINQEDFSILTSKDLDLLYINILEVSTVTNEDMDMVKTAVGVMLEDSFKDETFKSCKTCQERGLDKQRNCPLLDTKTHDKMVFYIVDNKKINVCPMDGINSPIMNDALRCYSILEGGFLPMSGGVYDQTQFFVEISGLVKGIISSHQTKMMEKK